MADWGLSFGFIASPNLVWARETLRVCDWKPILKMLQEKKLSQILVLGTFIRIVILGVSIFHSQGLSTDYTDQILPVARNILAGKGFTVDGLTPWAWKGPLYPLVTSIFVFLFGENFLFQRIFMLSLDLMCVYLVFQLGCLAFSDRVGLIAGFIWSLYIPSIWLAAILNYEALVTFLLLSSLVLLFQKGWANFGRASLAGLALSLATLCRAAALLLGPFLLVIGLFEIREWRTFFPKLCVFAFFSLLGVLPWTVRNYERFGTLIPVADSGASSLFWGSEKALLTTTEQKMALGWKRLASLGIGEQPEDAVARTHWWKRAAIKNYVRQWRENPRQLFDLYLTKAYKLFFYSDSGRWDRVLALVNLPIVIFSLLGFFAVRRTNSINIQILFWILVYFWMFHMPFHPFFRFLLPVFPIFILFASSAMERAWCFLARKT